MADFTAPIQFFRLEHLFSRLFGIYFTFLFVTLVHEKEGDRFLFNYLDVNVKLVLRIYLFLGFICTILQPIISF